MTFYGAIDWMLSVLGVKPFNESVIIGGATEKKEVRWFRIKNNTCNPSRWQFVWSTLSNKSEWITSQIDDFQEWNRKNKSIDVNQNILPASVSRAPVSKRHLFKTNDQKQKNNNEEKQSRAINSMPIIINNNPKIEKYPKKKKPNRHKRAATKWNLIRVDYYETNHQGSRICLLHLIHRV